MKYLLKCRKCGKEYEYSVSDKDAPDFKSIRCPDCGRKLDRAFRPHTVEKANEEFELKSLMNQMDSDRNGRLSTADYMRQYVIAQREKERDLLKEGGKEAILAELESYE